MCRLRVKLPFEVLGDARSQRKINDWLLILSVISMEDDMMGY